MYGGFGRVLLLDANTYAAKLGAVLNVKKFIFLLHFHWPMARTSRWIVLFESIAGLAYRDFPRRFEKNLC
jgi:hypothetical protein